MEITKSSRALASAVVLAVSVSQAYGRDQHAQSFDNVIRNEGSCGFANAGLNQYLINTNSASRYRVTVRTTWHGMQPGQRDDIYLSEAGGRLFLGCTELGSTPPTVSYTREVVGEVKLE